MAFSRYQLAVAAVALVLLSGGVFAFVMGRLGSDLPTDVNAGIVNNRVSADTSARPPAASPGHAESSAAGGGATVSPAPAPSGAAGVKVAPAQPKTSKSTRKEPPKYKININRAGKDELTLLPGVGPVLADRIIRYREDIGFFAAPEDLTNVKGIGDKKLADILPYVRVD